IDALLVIDKPRGWTSHDVVARVRRLTGERRVGHAGTLDPLATGVLPLGIGQGTRVLEYLSDAGKAYAATIRLGIETDTYDAEGAIVATAPVDGITSEAVEAALQPFRGQIEQVPPRFSALKRAGRPLYEYARAGVEIDPAPRSVQIDALRLSRCLPPELDLEIDCGSGFYVRSLAHDLGRTLGCGAHLIALVRTRVGPFQLDEASSVEALEHAAAQGNLGDLLWSLDAPLRGDPAVILGDAHVGDLVDGKTLHLPANTGRREFRRCRAYSSAGELIAVLTPGADGTLKPKKVFPAGRRGPNIVHPLHPLALSS
ncbi:MAG TPA: tRNA pseudouridine(55) synthase TruB, partial [Steroidobacteraceae bacterium]|nr:tRNA pseudouridine(55) synthase TruB [Steroidobacteraceae bacterium]